MNEAFKQQVRSIVMAEIEPLSAVLNQIWADIQAMKADNGEVIPDPPIPDPSIPDPPIPETRVPQTPIDIPPIPGFGPGAKMTEAEAQEMIRGLKGFPLLDGARGQAKADVGALARAVAALSRFAAAQGEGLEGAEVNPMIVLPEGCVGVDALVVPTRG